MKLRPSLAFLAVLVAALWLVPNAAAAITSTGITTPAGPRFAIPSSEATESMTVAGTAVDSVAGEEVDLLCYKSATSSEALASGVVVEADGSFEATGVEVPTYTLCTLRAVPAGTTPTGAEAEAFTGPLLADGGNEPYELGGDVNDGITDGYYVKAQQVSAADDYESAGDCGLADTYLQKPEDEEIETFFCNDYFEPEVEYGDGGLPDEPKESGFTVDGENAYFSSAAAGINGNANDFPELRYSVSQDPLTGDTTIEESQPIVVCDDESFPPSGGSCETFIESGVRDNRTIEQTHDGHLVVITDEFVSTDDQAHEIVALPDNQQNFGYHANTVEYEFPGESGYAHHGEGESVSFTTSGPATVYMQVEGAADDDTETGRGAIIMFQPSSPAYFNFDDDTERNSFYFENKATVPAGGSASVAYAYASSFEQAEVEALVSYAINGETAPVEPGGSTSSTSSRSTTQTSTAPAPTSKKKTSASAKDRFHVVKVKHDKVLGTARVEAKVRGAGTLTMSSPRLRTETRHASHAGTVWLAMKPTPELEKLLRERGVVHLAVTFHFTGDAGGSRTHVKQMHLIYRG